jgi:ubiquinone/menaquinone biosynthesis C-methylase UbiE
VTSTRIDYDGIAGTYDRRYLHNDYSGVERAVSEFAAQHRSGRVLEVGCGTGHWLTVLSGQGMRVAGLDASARMLARARERDRSSHLVRGVAEHLPWTDASFDRLLCVNAVHHFHDKRAFFSEARRVLRPGGRVMTVGLDPHTGVDRWYIYDYFEPVLEMDRGRYPASRQIQEWMEGAGFSDCVTREIQHVPVQRAARAALAEGRLDRTATSQLGLLTEEQYRHGIARIREDIESGEASGRTLYLTADLRLYATTGAVRS